MAAKLHRRGFEQAKRLVNDGKVVLDEREDWREHQPSAEQENEFIRRHGIAEFGAWHLGVDDAHPETTKGHYNFPYGDFLDVHLCAVLSAESGAGQYKHLDIQSAAAHLHGMLQAVKS